MRCVVSGYPLFLPILLFLGGLFPVRSAPLFDVPLELSQPDGSRLSVRVSGDEFYRAAHDVNGFTLIQNPDSGWWVYAGIKDGALVPTAAVPGHDSPAAMGLSSGLLPEPSARETVRAMTPESSPPAANVPNTGRLDNLVLFVRFADDTEFPASRPAYEALFNATDGNPSMRDYFREVSYGQLDVRSWFVPESDGPAIISYQDHQPRGYYLPYNAATNPIGYTDEPSGRKHALLLSALATAGDRLPPDMDLDTNDDGVLDHVTFVIRGAASVWGDILWPHSGRLPGESAPIGSVRPGPYDVQMENVLTSGHLGTLCHEFFHGFGAPDLYRYLYPGITPVGGWDLMGIPTKIPQHMGAYMKWKYAGWISYIPSVVIGAEYHLKPLTAPDSNSCKIGYSAIRNEYYVLEYRRKHGLYEASLMGEGLLVYRINTDCRGNMFGPPDEVYVYRPGGTLDTNGTLRDAAYSASSGRTRIDPTTDPKPFWSDGGYGSSATVFL